MDLTHNSTFRILPQPKSSIAYEAGIYRVIFVAPAPLKKTVTVLIQPDEASPKKASKGGRKRLDEKKLKHKRKKPRRPHVGSLLWMETDDLMSLEREALLRPFEIEREAFYFSPLKLSVVDQESFDTRKNVMAPFLDLESLTEGILVGEGLGYLTANAIKTHGASRSYVYELWSKLCFHGFDEKSLYPRRDRSGAPGVRRPISPGGRKKAGRKITDERNARKYHAMGVIDDEALASHVSRQPGMSIEWTAAILAADKHIPSPKPSMSTRCAQILNSAFCSKGKEVDGKFLLVKPEFGEYPNNAQISRVLTVSKPQLLRLQERTTASHFKMALRGLVARNWKGVAGPNHTWAIDSSVGDIYLRSSIDRSWIVGRPIVYVIVDVWSTAVVGFYVCLTGPSWDTAKVSLFNAAADPALVGEQWGYVPIQALSPAPTMCYALMCDRGEYLSQGHRATAAKLLPLTSYAPPYRGDLKGVVEVLHRIEKDAQFLFLPGAMDFRRAELELRRVDPNACVFTVREYVQYLHEVFSLYNLTADRTHRVDAHMNAAGFDSSPAGLWSFGHAMGVGYRRHISLEDLITELLPGAEDAVVGRNSVRWAGCDYSSEVTKANKWTDNARNFGSWKLSENHYPGSMRQIWTPNVGGAGLLKLDLSDESRASPELTEDEWSDSLALAAMRKPGAKHDWMMTRLDALYRMMKLRDVAKVLTSEAIAKSKGGASPTFTEARIMELAAGTPEASEAKTVGDLQAKAADLHYDLMQRLLSGANRDD